MIVKRAPMVKRFDIILFEIAPCAPPLRRLRKIRDPAYRFGVDADKNIRAPTVRVLQAKTQLRAFGFAKRAGG